MVISLPQAERLGKLIRLLSSDKDGEVLGAVAAIQRIASFNDIADCIEAQPRRLVVDDMTPSSDFDPSLPWWEVMIEMSDLPWWTAMAHALLDRGELWGDRERDFLINIGLRQYRPSAGQQKWLHDIAARTTARTNRRAAA